MKKGEHAVAKFPIWKGTERTVKDEDGNDTDEKKTRMFMKTACFFTVAQVEPLKEKKAPAVAAVPSVSYGGWLVGT